MIKALKVMILEDLKADQELIKRQVLKYNSESVFTIASNKETFLEKLEWFVPDLILGDYNLPDFTGLDAFIHVKEHKPFVPFIFVTGGLNDNDAVAHSVLKVADGFILKSDMNNLHQLLANLLEDLDAKIQSNATKIKKQTQERIKILKAVNLLESAPGFEGKEELVSLLNSLD